MKKIALWILTLFIVWTSIFSSNLYAGSFVDQGFMPQSTKMTIPWPNGWTVNMECTWSVCRSVGNPANTPNITLAKLDENRFTVNVNGIESTCEKQTWCVWWNEETNKYAESMKDTSTPSTWPITIYTSEKIPGAKCTCVSQTKWNNESARTTSCDDITTRKYACVVQPWLGNFQKMFATIIRYLINITLLLGVLAMVGLGIAWSWAGGDDAKAKSSLKKWWVNIIVWLMILFLFQYILRFIAPWIYQ